MKDVLTRWLPGSLLALALVAAACAPAAPPPTAPPAKPTEAPKAAAPAKPTEAPAAKPAEAKPAASPAAKAEAKPAASPAAKPVEAKPAASPKPAAKFDEKAVADFYRGKTMRIIVGFGAGGPYDVFSRLMARHMPKYIPGTPNIVVEPRPGAAGAIAANSVYNTEPKDGTILGSFGTGLPLQQALGTQGIQFDAAKFHWLGNLNKTFSACAVMKSAGINSFNDVVGPSGKELAVAAIGPGTSTYDGPAVMNAVLGAKFRIVSGYAGTPTIIQSLENGETASYCTSFDSFLGPARRMVEGDNAPMKIFAIVTSELPTHPWVKDATPVIRLARDDDGRRMLEAVDATQKLSLPLVLAPEAPADRVAAVREAVAKTFADKEFIAEAEKAGFEVNPGTPEGNLEQVRLMLTLPPSTLAKLKDILK